MAIRWFQRQSARSGSAGQPGELLLTSWSAALAGYAVTQFLGKMLNWRIVGIYRLVGNSNPPAVYANYEYLSYVLNRPGQVSSLRLNTSPKDPATEARVARALETLFKANGIQVANIRRRQQTATLDVVVVFLMVMAVLIAIVGGLGLMGTMSMNVLVQLGVNNTPVADWAAQLP
jgi:ABC-type lipoprotein release transport system permease subunit